jgi:uncharacterized protein (UPF0332 family)
MLNQHLNYAKQYYMDANELFRQERYNSSASRAYYASYHTMWAALGEPVSGKRWKHIAIIKHFVRGYWLKPDHSLSGPGLLEEKRLPLRTLYDFRLKSDYDTVSVDASELKQLLIVTGDIIKIVEKVKE